MWDRKRPQMFIVLPLAGSQLREPELIMQWSWIGCCGLWIKGFVVTEEREHKKPLHGRSGEWGHRGWSAAVSVRTFGMQKMPISRFSTCLVWKMNRNSIRAAELTWANTAWLLCPGHLLLCKCHHPGRALSIPHMYTVGCNSNSEARDTFSATLWGQNYHSK